MPTQGLDPRTLDPIWLTAENSTELQDPAASFRELHADSWLSHVYASPDKEELPKVFRSFLKTKVWRMFRDIRHQDPDKKFAVVFDMFGLRPWVLHNMLPRQTLEYTPRILIRERQGVVTICPLDVFVQEMSVTEIQQGN